MVSSFAPGVMIAITFCIGAWARLTIKNWNNRLFIFSTGSGFIFVGYILAFIQYIDIFYIYHTPQPDSAMYWLFGRMLFHCTGALIFNYSYHAMPSLKK